VEDSGERTCQDVTLVGVKPLLSMSFEIIACLLRYITSLKGTLVGVKPLLIMFFEIIACLLQYH
jgi:hypothetical protein